VFELLFVTMLRSLSGAVENVTSGITRIIECILVNECIYDLEMIILTNEMI
jgi:hypothetical protein